jgi:tRNA modification GTPase
MQDHIHDAEQKHREMNVFAAVMTGKGSAAIATVQVFGDNALSVIEQIFTPSGNKSPQFKSGEILLGVIHDKDKVIDQVTIGCEHDKTFAIHCHGNPLIVEMIIELLQHKDVEILNTEQFLIKTMSSQNTGTIAIEAKLAIARAVTVPGTKIIYNQIHTGLSSRVQQWLENINETPLETIKAEAVEILQKSRIAKLIIYGCKVVLAGPPNSGKSTLFNQLTGKEGSIVTDIKGTTRDWVSQPCRIGQLSVELIDTAGLDESLSDHDDSSRRSEPEPDSIEKAAQQKSLEMLQRADLILLVLDGSQGQIYHFPFSIDNFKVLTVLNKSDLIQKISNLQLKIENYILPEVSSTIVSISAKSGAGIEELKEKILQITGVADFDLKETICFTPRQQNLLEQLTNCESTQQATSIMKELLTDRISELTNL